MDLFNLAAHRRDTVLHPGPAFGLDIDRALVVGVHEDQLFPIHQQADVAAMLRGEGVPTEFVELSSPYGHDAFLVEDALFAPLLSGFLAGNAAAAPLSATP